MSKCSSRNDKFFTACIVPEIMARVLSADYAVWQTDRVAAVVVEPGVGSCSYTARR